MDIKEAVKDQANYADIVRWFSDVKDPDPEQLVLLVDTISEMSDQIYEHYRALCDMLKNHLQRIRRICREKGCREAFPEDSVREQIAYVVSRACELRAVLPERYEELLGELNK